MKKALLLIAVAALVWSSTGCSTLSAGSVSSGNIPGDGNDQFVEYSERPLHGDWMYACSQAESPWIMLIIVGVVIAGAAYENKLND